MCDLSIISLVFISTVSLVKRDTRHLTTEINHTHTYKQFFPGYSETLHCSERTYIHLMLVTSSLALTSVMSRIAKPKMIWSFPFRAHFNCLLPHWLLFYFMFLHNFKLFKLHLFYIKLIFLYPYS